MKKIISLILASAAVAVMLTGCGNAKYKAYDSTGERYDCYLPDYIDVCDYNGLEVPYIQYVMTEEELQKRIDRDIAVFCQDEWNPDRGAQYGDIADIVTECTMDGEVYDYLTFKLDNRDMGKSIVVGCNELGVPALDEAIMGMRQGETKTVTVNMPDPYYRSLAVSGKEITVTITMNNLYGIELPEATDEFFEEHYGYTLSDYKAYVTNTTETEYNEFLEDYKSDLVWNYIYENSTVKEYPEEYENLYNETLDAYRSYAKEEKNTNLVTYVTETLGYEDLEAFEADLAEDVKATCKREMILYYVARCENLNYTDEYYEAELLEYGEDFELKETADIESFIDYQVGLSYFKERVRLNYVYNWLGDNAKVREDITTYTDLNK